MWSLLGLDRSVSASRKNKNDKFQHLYETVCDRKFIRHFQVTQQLCYLSQKHSWYQMCWEKLCSRLRELHHFGVCVKWFIPLIKRVQMRNVAHFSSWWLSSYALLAGMLCLSRDCGDIWWWSGVLLTKVGMKEMLVLHAQLFILVSLGLSPKLLLFYIVLE